MINDQKPPSVPTREDRKLRREQRMRKRQLEEEERKEASKNEEDSHNDVPRQEINQDVSYNIVGKDIDLQGFIQALFEASPIIERVFDLHGNVSIEDQDTKKDLVALVKIQERISLKIVEFAGLNDKIINHRLIIRRLMALTSELLHLYKLDINKPEEVDFFETKIIDSFKILVENRESTKEVFSDILSSDRILNIKLGLFDSTCNLNRVASLFKFDQTEREIYNHFLATTTEMARDLAFNWSKRANIEDKETLFELCIPKCGSIYIQAWLDNAIDTLGGNKGQITEDDFWRHFPVLDTVLEEMDMGYKDHEKYNFIWLKKRISKNIISRVQALSLSGLPTLPGQSSGLLNGIIREYVVLASTAWNEASNNYIAKCESMTPDEMDVFATTEGLEPMKLDLYFEALDIQIESWKGIGEHKSLSFDKIKANARKRLSFLWGISDAICKIKK